MILPQYKKASEMPNVSDIINIHAERETKYKSIDADGNVYIIHNPAAWQESTDADGRTTRHRPPATLAYTAKAAIRAAEDKPEKQKELAYEDGI